MDKKSRLAGIDLLKGIAAYGVVVIHSEGGLSQPTGYWAEKLGVFFDFAVPFFLATSFYLTSEKICLSNNFLKSRLPRLIIPYLFWTLVYFLFRVSKYLFSGNYLKLNEILKDPISLMFLGGAAVQLYFIPLLCSGVLLATAITRPLAKKETNIKVLFALLTLGLFLYDLLLRSGNSFHLGPNVSFENLVKFSLSEANNNQVIRLLLVEISWLVRCLPYIIVAIILKREFFQKLLEKLKNKWKLIIFVLFFALDTSYTFGVAIFPLSVTEISRAYLSLLLAISLSNNIKENPIITNIGVCSFGIYLIHHLLIEVIRPLIYKIYPSSISVLTILLCATVSFIISWAATFYLRKAKWISKIMFFA